VATIFDNQLLLTHNHSIGEEGVEPVLITKMRKGQELHVKCVARKVEEINSSSTVIYKKARELPKSMQNGHRVLPWHLNMIPIISYAIHHTGLKAIKRPSGLSVRMLLKRKLHEMTPHSTIPPMQTDFIWKLKQTEAWAHVR